MSSDKPSEQPTVLPDHESGVRRAIADASGRPYHPLRSLDEARSYPDGAVIFEGDWGGQIYATCPASLVRCAEETLDLLLRDFDAVGWCELAGARVFYERLPVGAGVAGGMGGGRIIQGVWVHDRIARLGLTSAIRDTLTGVRPPNPSIYYDLPAWDNVASGGFTFGQIEDARSGRRSFGTAFVVAPDGSRAGLCWHTVRPPQHLAARVIADPRARRYYTQPDYFEQLRPFEPHRWGIWSVAFPHPMRLHDPIGIREDARRNLETITPKLRAQWENWRREFGGPGAGESAR